MKDERIQVWTTQNIGQQNGAWPVSNIRRRDSDPRRLSLYVQDESRQSGKDESRERGIKGQISEVPLTCLQKFATWRFVMVLLLHSSFVFPLILRNCLPMAMVCMARPHSSASSTSQMLKELINMTNTHNKSDQVKDGRHVSATENGSLYGNSTQRKVSHYEFDWDSEVQGLILTSIMFTSFLGPLLASFMISRLGCKWTLTLNNILSALLTFLTPIAARLSPYCLVAVRVLLGTLTTGITPVASDCIAWWAPQDEKLTMSSLTYTGMDIGATLSSFLSGYLCLVPLDNGWPFVFYTFGAVTLLYSFVWHLLSSQKPEDHPYISEKEKQYIISHRVGMDFSSGEKKTKLPCREILRSRPSLAYLTSGICHFWASQLLYIYLPMFFSKSLGRSVQDSGLLVSLTSLLRIIGALFWTVVGNKISARLDIKRSRKICICVGFFMAGVSAVVVGFVEAHLMWVSTAVLVCLMIFQSVGSSTVAVVPLDMAPRYAGFLNGLMVSFGGIIAVSGPLITAAIITDGTHESWRTVWIIIGSVFFIAAIIFLLFGQAALQSYALGKKPNLPHIVHPFVTMGRTFSAFIEAPLTSSQSAKSGFDVAQNYQPTDRILSLFTASPKIVHPGNI